jgi:hypothetical protein
LSAKLVPPFSGVAWSVRRIPYGRNLGSLDRITSITEMLLIAVRIGALAVMFRIFLTPALDGNECQSRTQSVYLYSNGHTRKPLEDGCGPEVT